MHQRPWLPTLDDAREEVADGRKPGAISRVVLYPDGRPIAWAAMAHQWGRIWELHPMIVAVDHQRRGHGRRLAGALEGTASARGALTMWVGTSDTTGATTVSGIDLYADPLGVLATLESRAPHPFEFWKRVGYRVVGTVPDAEGPGQPSICLAKHVGGLAPIERDAQ